MVITIVPSISKLNGLTRHFLSMMGDCMWTVGRGVSIEFNPHLTRFHPFPPNFFPPSLPPTKKSFPNPFAVRSHPFPAFDPPLIYFQLKGMNPRPIDREWGRSDEKRKKNGVGAFVQRSIVQWLVSWHDVRIYLDTLSRTFSGQIMSRYIWTVFLREWNTMV